MQGGGTEFRATIRKRRRNGECAPGSSPLAAFSYTYTKNVSAVECDIPRPQAARCGCLGDRPIAWLALSSGSITIGLDEAAQDTIIWTATAEDGTPRASPAPVRAPAALDLRPMIIL